MSCNDGLTISDKVYDAWCEAHYDELLDDWKRRNTARSFDWFKKPSITRAKLKRKKCKR